MSAAPGLFRPPTPQNEPVKSYAPGTPEREELRNRLQQMQSEQIEAPMVIGGKEVRTGATFDAERGSWGVGAQDSVVLFEGLSASPLAK